MYEEIVRFLLSFSISPYTVSSHMRNIMLKLGRNSREGVIDFIERSPLLFLLKEHYTDLSVYSAFEKGLHNFGKERVRKHKSSQRVHLILYGRNQAEQKTFQRYLEAHLKDAALQVYIENTRENNDLEERTKNVKQNTPCLVLSLDLDTGEGLSQKLFEFEVLTVKEYQNYYFLILEILRKFLPNINLIMCFQDLRTGQGRGATLREECRDEDKGKWVES